MTLRRSLAASGLLALPVGAATAITPAAAPAHHNKAVKICQANDRHHRRFQHWDSAPILINGAGGRRVGRIAIATPAIGRPNWTYCAVAIKKRHKHKRRMAVSIGFADAPHVHARDRGRFRGFAGPVYLSGTYRDDGDRYVEVKARIGKRGFGILQTRPPR